MTNYRSVAISAVAGVLGLKSSPRVAAGIVTHGEATTSATGVFYIGLGDRFDDERRLVRETVSAPRSTPKFRSS